jgi:NADH dehydrogenase FAD-containing subunit
VAGDAAYFSYKGGALRMAIQFALSQGVVAAENIARSIGNLPLTKYAPHDLGYIVPMANNRSCGRALGVNIKGTLGMFLHYFFCVYRSYGFGNRLGIIGSLIKGGA